MTVIYNNGYVTLYKYQGIPKVVFKTLGTGLMIIGFNRIKFDFMNPVIHIQNDVVDYPLIDESYNYIEMNGQFYFILNYIHSSGGVELQLELDVLYTYRTEIDNYLILTFERSSFHGNKDMIDPLLPISPEKSVYAMRSSVNPFTPVTGTAGRNAGSYVLVTSQSIYNTP